jgi:imidazole glycerol-phosphate synthase subunit HisH
MNDIIIVDYGMGNLGSVRKNIDALGVKSLISSDPQQIKNCDKIILPGVGHFGKAVQEIKARGLWDLLSEHVKTEQKPILGICLGMQLMAAHSEEGDAEGFGWFDARVIRFKMTDAYKFKVPHIGWNSIQIVKESKILTNIPNDSQFYFVHSYHVVCNDYKDILSTTIYENEFVSAIQKNNIAGTQFHPEKSQDAGMQLLKNFISL